MKFENRIRDSSSASLMVRAESNDAGVGFGIKFKPGEGIGRVGVMLSAEDVDKLVAYLTKDKKAHD